MDLNNNVVMVGRINVGKSTLFNRLSTTVKSLTLDYEGVTRDFIKDHVIWSDRQFTLIDSGGITLRKINDPLLSMVRHQVLQLIQDASVIIFVLDGVVGITGEDRDIAKLLHKQGKPVIVAVNKIDVKEVQENLYVFEELGFKKVIGISAEHALNLNELLDAIVSLLPESEKKLTDSQKGCSVIFLGKPNVGKSSLLNSVLGQERALVSEIPGTTREALAEHITFYRETLEVVDTPGIRRKRKIDEPIESMMVKSSFHALKKGNVVALLLDGSQRTIVDQELKLAFYAFEEQQKGLVLIVNKSDLMDLAAKEALAESFEPYKHLIKKIPIIYISCKTGKNVGRVIPLIQQVCKKLEQRFDKEALEFLLISGLMKKPLYHSGQKLMLFSVTQKETKGIMLVLEVNQPDWFGPSQLSFFEGLLRKEFDLIGVPVIFKVVKPTKYYKEITYE